MLRVLTVGLGSLTQLLNLPLVNTQIITKHNTRFPSSAVQKQPLVFVFGICSSSTAKPHRSSFKSS